MSASLNDAGFGSGVSANALRYLSAGDGVAMPGGSSGSRGPPECGASHATDMKNGRRPGAAAAINSFARAVMKSVE
jgi:hypothetical protein